MNGTGIGEVKTKLVDTDHKQWNCGMGVFDPDVVYTLEYSNGYVMVDEKLSKTVSKSDYEKVYQKIGDKYYKTVKIGNLLWMAENLDYKWDGLLIGTDQYSQGMKAAAYRNDDEATWGWNGRKCGLYYNKECITYDENIDYYLRDTGWRLPTYEEYDALLEYVNDGTNTYRIDKLFVPNCSWSPYEHPADAKMNETGLSLLPAGYYVEGQGWSDITEEHMSNITINEAQGSEGCSWFINAPTSSTYGSFDLYPTDHPAPIRLVKDV